MTLRKQLQDELASRGPISRDDPQEISAPVGDAKVRVRVRESGPIGVSVDEIAVDRPAMDGKQGRKACEKIEEDVHYLLEPLELQETDAQSDSSRMRSRQPTTDEDGKHYYELQAEPGGLGLKRYVKSDDEPRQEEPIDLTREQLYRLAEDLGAASGADP